MFGRRTMTMMMMMRMRMKSGGMMRMGSSVGSTKVLEKYTAVEGRHVEELETLGIEVETDADVLLAAGKDWSGRYAGGAGAMVYPRDAEEVAKVLQMCVREKIAVVPQGGNTGLVGGSVPLGEASCVGPDSGAKEMLLSLRKMGGEIEVDVDAGVVHASAGVVLETLEGAVGEHGFTLPLDLGAKGSCHIGGNVATNAGGIHFVRYGSLHGSVLGLQVVLPNGDILDSRSSLRKNNTGYDLKQLFIGSEGTLGVITAVSLALPPKPVGSAVALLGLDSFQGVVKTMGAARGHLGESLSAAEFMDRRSLESVVEHVRGVDPLASAPPFYLLIEAAGSSPEQITQRMDSFLESALADAEALDVVDGTLAADESQAAELWHLREGAAEGILGVGKVYKYDVSIPTGEMYDLVEETKDAVAHIEGAVVVGYGHVGDANLHLNIAVPEYSDAARDALEPFVYQRVAARSGSISAEHGLGQMKAGVAHYSQSDQALEWMKRVKAVFDPEGVLNPGKLLI